MTWQAGGGILHHDMSEAGLAESSGETSSAAKQRALAFAEGLAAAVTGALDISAAIVGEETEGITIAFTGEDAHYLVGRGGKVLDALQYIASNVINRRANSRQRLHIVFDADGYRARREATLIKLATELAVQVASTGQEAVLDPLSPLERRIVHNALKDAPGVRTYSEGEDPERFIIISPAV